ncbi:hypothetical protein D0T12_04480 [Actinomadura spongiicola]|uniref:Ig-like domain-containing protein n=1 Tax=Actinomadura spongiicola TaxID=2303421 RepID=A0A372GQ12_9ACTN|nr:hypothetical protein [Actinomadura spongiicola]RFS87481.1 hypothetical protein D0T12_04480 [Actinomadura spongiicola]
MSRVRKAALSAAALSTVVAGATVVASPSAEARTCITRNNLKLFQGAVLGDRSIYCNPPDVLSPLPTTIQKKSGTTWVSVTPTGDGGASYVCKGTATSTYRLKEAPSKQTTVPCS